VSGAASFVRALFVEPRPRAQPASMGLPPATFPTVAILCAPGRVQPAAAAFALALAGVCGTGCAVGAAVGTGAAVVGPALLASSARRPAARLRERGHAAAAVGRLVWLGDGRGGVDGHAEADAGDAAGHAAAMSAELGRAGAALRLPGAVAVPLARSAALDRVLAWHDAIVVVRESEGTAEIEQLIVDSLAALGRPVLAVPAPGRIASVAATTGLRAPAIATQALTALGIGAPGA
jgi:hypothetical protein